VDFAFLVMKTMRFYGWSWQQTMSTPISAFWTCNKFIDRLRADEMLGWTPLHAFAAANEEGRKGLLAALEEQKGTVVVEKPVFDADGWRTLKTISQQ
jgi:hypothetical protein